MRRSIAIAAMVASVAVLGACTTGDSGSSGGVDLSDDGVAGTVLAGLGDGAPPVDFAALRGNPVVVNFFASYCTPCVREMPAFQQVHLAAGDAVTFVGVAVNDRVADALDLADRTGVTYLLAADPQGAFFTEAASTTVLPTTLVLDADGRVAARLLGETTTDQLVDELADLDVHVAVP